MVNCSRWFNRILQAVILAGGLYQASCGTAAYVKHDGKIDEGTIRKSNQRVLILEDESGGKQLIPRTKIEDIDHPGNVAALTGLGLLAWTAAYFVAPAAMGCDLEEEAFCQGFMLPVGITGAALSIYGTSVWGQSTFNAR